MDEDHLYVQVKALQEKIKEKDQLIRRMELCMEYFKGCVKKYDSEESFNKLQSLINEAGKELYSL